MAMFSGKNGKAYYDVGEAGQAAFAYITSWSANVDLATAEANYMNQSGDWSSNIALQKGWSASVSCYLDAANIVVNLADADAEGPITVELWFTDTQTDGILSGSAIITGMSVDESATDYVTISYELKGTGALSYIIDTATD